MHHLDSNEMPGEKARWELCKDAVLNNSWKQHSTKQQLYRHLPPIWETIHIRWAKHSGHCWRSKGNLTSNILQSTSVQGHTSDDWPAKIYIHQLCADTGYCRELPRVMTNRDGGWDRVKGICVVNMPWWWWWWWNCLIYSQVMLFVKKL